MVPPSSVPSPYREPATVMPESAASTVMLALTRVLFQLLLLSISNMEPLFIRMEGVFSNTVP